MGDLTIVIITEESVLIFKMEVCLTLKKGDDGDRKVVRTKSVFSIRVHYLGG